MIIAGLAILGAIFGSFVNALVWRLHEQSVIPVETGIQKKQKGKKQSSNQLTAEQLSITKGRSMCPNCHHELAAQDLIPVLSWISLRGKCQYCHQPISWQYPAVELATAGLFALSYIAWPLAFHGIGLFQFVLWLIFLVGFMALAVYDLRWFTLPDKLVYPLGALALVQTVVVAVWLHHFSSLWQPALGAVIIFGLFWLLFQISKGNWIGGGDVKLALILGALAATPFKTFLVIFLSSLLGTIISIPLLAKGKQGLKLHIPYGPYLLMATYIVVLYGDSIVRWYQNLLV